MIFSSSSSMTPPYEPLSILIVEIKLVAHIIVNAGLQIAFVRGRMSHFDVREAEQDIDRRGIEEFHYT